MAAQIQTISVKQNPFEKLGAFVIRYGLVLVLGWIGAMKFTAYEAEGIKALVETSPFMSWMYKVFSLQATSNVIGIAELTAAALIAIRPLAPKLSAILLSPQSPMSKIRANSVVVRRDVSSMGIDFRYRLW